LSFCTEDISGGRLLSVSPQQLVLKPVSFCIFCILMTLAWRVGVYRSV